MKKISIVVPIYNTAKYLDRCITSILNQTLRDIEIILINDGSTDNSLEICEKYSKLDNRIIVVSKENEGLSATKNLGIKMAQGEFFGFVDSDDYASEDMFEILYNYAQEYQADIVQCQHYSVLNDRVVDRPNTHGEKNIEFYDLCKKEDKLSLGQVLWQKHVVNWNKLYRTEVYKDMIFPDKKFEDLFLYVDSIRKARRIVFIPDKLYYYRENRTGSIMYRKNMDTNSLIEANFIDYYIMYLEDYFDFIKDMDISRKFIIKLYRKMYKDIRENDVLYNEMIIKKLEERMYVISRKNVSIRHKVEFYILYKYPKFYNKYLKIVLKNK